MQKLYYSLAILLISLSSLLAQNNYVATIPNSATPGSNNTLVGSNAGSSDIADIKMVGVDNVFLGTSAGRYSSTGSRNVFLGNETGRINTQGNDNVFVGNKAGNLSQEGNSNTYIGAESGINNSSGSFNTFLGYQAGWGNTTATANTFIGNGAGHFTMTGSGNVFLGSLAGYNNQNGSGNLFMGHQAGVNAKASYNLFIGNSSGNATTTGGGNTAIGDGSLLSNTTGTNNVSIGRYAGVDITTGSNNTFIGTGATVSTSGGGITNSIAIGYNAIVKASNCLALGGEGINGVRVGINNGLPKNSLEITKDFNQSGLRFTYLTSASPATVFNQTKFLTVDANGDVILGSSNGSARLGKEDAYWQLNGSSLQNSQGESVIIGANVNQTPVGYKLYVAGGILTEKVKVAVKNTADWSDKVFDETYELKSLSEVGEYIQVNKHLPGIPSAQEMVEKGNDLHKTDAKLLEKIEELTLYSIQLEKKLETEDKKQQQQQTEIDELKRLVKQLMEKK